MWGKKLNKILQLLSSVLVVLGTLAPELINLQCELIEKTVVWFEGIFVKSFLIFIQRSQHFSFLIFYQTFVLLEDFFSFWVHFLPIVCIAYDNHWLRTSTFVYYLVIHLLELFALLIGDIKSVLVLWILYIRVRSFLNQDFGYLLYEGFSFIVLQASKDLVQRSWPSIIDWFVGVEAFFQQYASDFDSVGSYGLVQRIFFLGVRLGLSYKSGT